VADLLIWAHGHPFVTAGLAAVVMLGLVVMLAARWLRSADEAETMPDMHSADTAPASPLRVEMGAPGLQAGPLAIDGADDDAWAEELAAIRADLEDPRSAAGGACQVCGRSHPVPDISGGVADEWFARWEIGQAEWMAQARSDMAEWDVWLADSGLEVAGWAAR